MSTSPNAYVTESPTPPSSPRPSLLRRPFVDGRASAPTDFLVFSRAREGQQPGQVLSSSWKKKKRRPAVKIINRKAYVVLSWLVRV